MRILKGVVIVYQLARTKLMDKLVNERHDGVDWFEPLRLKTMT